MPTSSEARMEFVLAQALRRFSQAKARAERERTAGADLRFLFARLGLSMGDLESLSLAAGSGALAAPLRERLHALLGAERIRLRRLARSNSASYDANRHLAVRTALDWIEGAGRTDAPCERLSGAALNARFRGRRRKALAAEGRPAKPFGVAPSADPGRTLPASTSN